jgi:peptidyl-tRNA hydrolase, PTH2 family
MSSDETIASPGSPGARSSPEATAESINRRPKQVIVMRKDLNMRKGKMIAQGAHAAMKVLLDAGGPSGDHGSYAFAMTPAMAQWIVSGRFAKVCVGVASEAELDDIVARAHAAGLPVAMIVDSGKTEFHGVPTKTCCAVGPAWADEVDAITGTLTLL